MLRRSGPATPSTSTVPPARDAHRLEPVWSVHADSGATCAPRRRLLSKDSGEPDLPPLSPRPIYDVSRTTAGSGRYTLCIHNYDGHNKNYGAADTSYHRRPFDLVSGSYQAGADQRVWFAELEVVHGPRRRQARLTS